ncbi:MAG: hypothetical protein CFE45_14885 [Burkholderiales bacterium PBB5]|nr:MAG: hypothetical protein CFE45_14885 [Burkholderiales bacterium PBB5]
MTCGLPKHRAIQMCFPDEPDWDGVEESVLVDLVQDFEWEPSCATSAILELSHRQSPHFKALAHWLLGNPAADRWLKAAATDALALREGNPGEP